MGVENGLEWGGSSEVGVGEGRSPASGCVEPAEVGGGGPGQRLRPPRPPPGLTQHEIGQLRVLQVVHHDHFAREVVAHREEELGLGGRGAVHDAQVVLAQEGQRRHRDALELALQLLGGISVAGGRGQHRRRPPAAGEQGAEPG